MAAPNPYIRPVDRRRDLTSVADIIEACFSDQMDEEGRSYIRQIRRAAARAHEPALWFADLADTPPLRGFVWEQDGRVVGNLTLIPFLRGVKPVYLIANVAVLPQFRRAGIGRQLTSHAVAHVRELGGASAWLHVRDDNPAALHLYQSLGFEERARRSTWVFENLNFVQPVAPQEVAVTRRKAAEWPAQRACLQQDYPPEVAWNLPFKPGSLGPLPWQALGRWFNGLEIRQWSAWRGAGWLGTLAREPTGSHYDWLWLACPPAEETPALRALLPAARLGGRLKPLLINYPAGRAGDVLSEQGFALRNTLIWMELPLAGRNLQP